MPAVVLESSIGSQYEDSPGSYEFPSQYLRYFDAPEGQPLFAVLYEPRGDDGRGRMQYVALAEIAGSPVPTGRTTRNGRPLFVVRYARPAVPFEQPVPREVLGDPIETWLRAKDRGRARNVATFGRAVRPLTDSDFQRILELAGAANLESTTYPTLPDHPEPLVAARERAEVLVDLIKRSDDFRRQILVAYGEQCAVSGLGLGSVPLTKSRGLLDAAHIRPVARGGPDAVTNGLPLTPTLHRMFDAGFFSAEYRDGRPVVVVSPRLEQRMIVSQDGRFRLELRDGLPLHVPLQPTNWPNRHQLDYHRTNVLLTG